MLASERRFGMRESQARPCRPIIQIHTPDMNTRRHFLRSLMITAGAPALLTARAFSQDAPAKLEESDPTATALGYKEDTTKVDATKYPMHKAEQKCVDCVLYTGKAGEATGPCSAFAGKLVTAAGWCAAYAKKPDAAPATEAK